jgi:hypothetical protein
MPKSQETDPETGKNSHIACQAGLDDDSERLNLMW